MTRDNRIPCQNCGYMAGPHTPRCPVCDQPLKAPKPEARR
jgi:RNA polymerase subunit RPABC4/transcription elongation factor Spt4